MSRKAVLIGASGLIGSHLLQLLLNSDEYSEVLIFSRSSLSISHPKFTQEIIDFNNIRQYSSLITGDVIFSCLGSTRNKTPNKNEYQKIDKNYPLAFAKIGLENGAKQFHIVTSLNADPESSSSYLKLKGELENELKKLPYYSLQIYQPSYLEGLRKENRIDDRLMKPLMRLLNPLLVGQFKKYRSINASEVAQAMFNQSIKDLSGTYIYTSNKIKELV
ncbi:MAG: nucleoside-diphosphate sugar epimerase [Pyrinomonadaceae bacterium]|nr:nucleoside-diphosphate sugar epimerase [Sphingobacteriaceae bacterium]